MFMRSKFGAILVLLAMPSPVIAEGPGLGEPLSATEIPFFATYVLSDGTGLPPGQGHALDGAKVWASTCAVCHGETGREGPMPPVVGPTDSFSKPAGQFWPYATTIFDYVRRAMPFPSPKVLSDDEVYSVTAYILYENGVISESHVLNMQSLPEVKMPNRENFVDHWANVGETPYGGLSHGASPN